MQSLSDPVMATSPEGASPLPVTTIVTLIASPTTGPLGTTERILVVESWMPAGVGLAARFWAERVGVGVGEGTVSPRQY